MTVFFDHQAFCIQEYGGLSRYYTELIEGLKKTDDVTPLLPLRWSNNRHLQDAGLHNRPFFANRQFRGKRNLLYTANRWNDIRAIQTQSFDIFHATYYDSYFLPYLNARKTKTPLVVTFLDMTHEKLGHQFPELAQDKAIVQHKRLLASRADRLIAVSESTKRDMVDILNIDPAKIDVIYHGSSFTAAHFVAEPQYESVSAFPYLLFVGRRSGYKNFDWMLTALSPLLNREKLRLRCAGGGAFTTEEQQLIQSLGVGKLVSQQAVSDGQLQQLYQGAIAFLFPSLYEGFGIPVLEAMACGCPCILGSQSSLPEVGGDAALYIDANESEKLAAQIYQLMTSAVARHELIQRGYKRLKRFQWPLLVRQTADLYKSAYITQ